MLCYPGGLKGMGGGHDHGIEGDIQFSFGVPNFMPALSLSKQKVRSSTGNVSVHNEPIFVAAGHREREISNFLLFVCGP